VAADYRLPRARRQIDWQQAVQGVLALHRQGRLDEAESLYRQLLRSRPEDANLNHFDGVLLFQRQRVDEAMARVRRSIALDPKVASWHNNLGNMLLEAQQPVEAAQAYERCLALEPDNVEVRNNLACLLRQNGHLREAEALLRDAIARSPAYGEAYTNLAVALAQQGRIDESIDAHMRALELQPDNPRSRRILGVLYAQRGERDRAAQVFRGWLAQCPDDPQARHHLAAATGQDVPERASDAYVVQVFDRFAASFDVRLAHLGYRAPALCAEVLKRRIGPPDARRSVLDAGCGTGLCGPVLRPYALELTGVDLSPRMLDHARARGLYDRIEQGELSAWLTDCVARFDLIVSADTLCYFGALQPILAAARGASQPGGWLVFTVEALDEPASAGYDLRYHGRYAHDRAGVEGWLRASGWQAIELAPVVLRQESGRPVAGWLVSAQAPRG
jgi:predicted TPR repeat methyltransferase